MRKLLIISPFWGVIALFAAFGSWEGVMREKKVEVRGGYRVLEGDFHVHTRFSDGFLSPFDVVIAAQRKGLHVVGLTEHNMVLPGKLARWFSSLIEGPVILVGQEVTTRDYHLIALG